MDQSFGLHAVEIGHPLGALQRPAHRVGSGVVRQWLSAVQHCRERHKLKRTLLHLTEDTRGAQAPSERTAACLPAHAPLGPAFPSLLNRKTETANGFKWITTT